MDEKKIEEKVEEVVKALQDIAQHLQNIEHILKDIGFRI